MIKKIDKDQYREFWENHNGSVLQSYQWGELKSDYWNLERLGFFAKEKLVGIVTLFIREIPYQKFLKYLKINKFGYIPRGPIVDNMDNINEFIADLSLYFEKSSLDFVLLDPGKNFSLKNWDEILKQSLVGNNWQESGTTIQPNQTDIIKIKDLEDDVLKSFKTKWRRNARKAKKHGVKISKGKTIEDVRRFYIPLKSVAQRGSFNVRSQKYFEKMWKYLKKDNLIDLFIAEAENKTIASYLVVKNKEIAYELYGGATLKGRDLEASFLLKQKILESMREENIELYDQWGVAPKGEKDHPLSGISYFKKGFGGDYVQFLPQYAMVNSIVAFKSYKFFSKFRSGS